MANSRVYASSGDTPPPDELEGGSLTAEPSPDETTETHHPFLPQPTAAPEPRFSFVKNSVRSAAFDNEEPSDGVSKWHKGFSEQINDVLAEKPRMRMQVVALLLALSGFFTSCAGSELLYQNSNTMNDEVNAWKIATSATTLLLLIVVFLMHDWDLNIEKRRGYVAPESTIFSAGRHRSIWFDLIVCAIHAPAYVHMEFNEPVAKSAHDFDLPEVKAHHTLDSIANVLMTLRLYLLFPLIHHFLGLTGSGPRLVARYTNIIFDMNFTLKAILDRHSLRALVIMIVAVAVHASWCVKILERSLCCDWIEDEWEVVANTWGVCGQHQPLAYENFLDSFWNSIVTMTTVGYGDLSPLTIGGRIVSIWSSFLGITIFALLVNVMTDMTTFRPRERKAFDLISKGEYRQTTSRLACLLLQRCWLAHKYRKTGDMIKAKEYKKKYYLTYRMWKTNLREILVNENKVDDVAIMTSEMMSLRRDFKDMLFTATVDLEDRMDRRLLRLLKEIMNEQQILLEDLQSRGYRPTNVDSEDLEVAKEAVFRRKLTKLISRLPEDAVKESIIHGEEHVHTAHEEEEVSRLEDREEALAGRRHSVVPSNILELKDLGMLEAESAVNAFREK